MLRAARTSAITPLSCSFTHGIATCRNSRSVVTTLSSGSNRIACAAMLRPWVVLSTSAISSTDAVSSAAPSCTARPRSLSIATW